MIQAIKTVFLEEDRLFIIDQRLLPAEEKFIELKNESDVYTAVKTLAVRGAPAIGIAAAYGVYVSLKDKVDLDREPFRNEALKIIQYLSESRPTAYNLFYALNRMRVIIENDFTVQEMLIKLRDEALAIHREDLEKSSKIAEYGSAVLPEKAKIISHCNAGGLATGGLGTSLSVVYKAFREKKEIFVYVDETRPLLQGARLTAWELSKIGIPYKVITDNMAGMLMKKGEADLVIVGADRIARNGDFANKIGTYSLAVLADYHGIPFYTAAPVSTFDFSLESGEDIPIEERDEIEVLSCQGIRTSPAGAKAYNPAFDVTPYRLLTGIITEYGIIYPPFLENIKKIKDSVC